MLWGVAITLEAALVEVCRRAGAEGAVDADLDWKKFPVRKREGNTAGPFPEGVQRFRVVTGAGPEDLKKTAITGRRNVSLPTHKLCAVANTIVIFPSGKGCDAHHGHL